MSISGIAVIGARAVAIKGRRKYQQNSTTKKSRPFETKFTPKIMNRDELPEHLKYGLFSNFKSARPGTNFVSFYPLTEMWEDMSPAAQEYHATHVNPYLQLDIHTDSPITTNTASYNALDEDEEDDENDEDSKELSYFDSNLIQSETSPQVRSSFVQPENPEEAPKLFATNLVLTNGIAE